MGDNKNVSSKTKVGCNRLIYLRIPVNEVCIGKFYIFCILYSLYSFQSSPSVVIIHTYLTTYTYLYLFPLYLLLKL